jgi:hypothetical protein
MIRRLGAVDHGVMVWNILLLLCVGALPFTTALMAAYLKAGQGEHLAAAIYPGAVRGRRGLRRRLAVHHPRDLRRRRGLLRAALRERFRARRVNLVRPGS